MTTTTAPASRTMPAMGGFSATFVGLELRRMLDEIYSHHTGQGLEQVHDDMERDRFFSAQQAVDYGLVDRIISARELNRRKSGFAAA